MAKLEDYRERDKIRDAELALVKEKLAIVISSFETEKAKIIAEYTLNFHENKTKLAEQEYALASLKNSYDESQRARLSCEERINETQDELMVTMRENEILKANNEELRETIADLYDDTEILRKTLQKAYNTMEMAYHSHKRGSASNMIGKQNSNVNQNLDSEDETTQEILVALQKEIAQKNEKVVEMTKLLREKGDEIVVLKAENMNSLNRVKDTDILAKVKPTKTGNSLTSSGVRGRDVSQNDMILKAHKPGSIRSNASDTKTLPQQSLRKKMGFEAGKDWTRGKHEENLVQEVSKLKKRRRLLNQSTIEDIQRV